MVWTENSYSKPIDDSKVHKESKQKRRILKAETKIKDDIQMKQKTKIQTQETKKTKNVIRKRTKLTSIGLDNESEVVDLAKRRDVVNKTIFRILRRFLTQEFRALVPLQQEDKNSKRDKFFQSVKEYAKNIFEENHSEFKILHFYLASIIDHKYITKENAIACDINFIESTTFYDWIYKYSHTRLVNLFEVKPIGKIYEYFYNKAKDSVLSSESSVIKNSELYSQLLEEFNLIFQGKIDIATLII